MIVPTRRGRRWSGCRGRGSLAREAAAGVRGAERARGECLSRGSPKPGALNPAGRRCGAGAVAPREEISHEPDNTAGLGSDIGQVVSEAGAPGGRLSSQGQGPAPSRAAPLECTHLTTWAEPPITLTPPAWEGPRAQEWGRLPG